MPFFAPRPCRSRRRRWVAAFACLITGALLTPLAALSARAEPQATDTQAGPPALDARQTEVMGVICARCHARPGIGAPLLGDASAWAELREQGLETLTAHTVTGFGGMPALGTCSFCSEDDLRTLVAWMAGLELPAGRAASALAPTDPPPRESERPTPNERGVQP